MLKNSMDFFYALNNYSLALNRIYTFNSQRTSPTKIQVDLLHNM